MLSFAGFKGIREFNETLKSYPRFEIPVDIQERLRAIFVDHQLGSDAAPEELRISAGFIDGIAEDLVLKCPFRIPANNQPLEFEIYAMSVDNE